MSSGSGSWEVRIELNRCDYLLDEYKRHNTNRKSKEMDTQISSKLTSQYDIRELSIRLEKCDHLLGNFVNEDPEQYNHRPEINESIPSGKQNHDQKNVSLRQFMLWALGYILNFISASQKKVVYLPILWQNIQKIV